jgi:hypothetical protein
MFSTLPPPRWLLHLGLSEQLLANIYTGRTEWEVGDTHKIGLSDFDLSVKIQFVDAFFDRGWDSKIHLLNSFQKMFSLHIADFVFSC